MLAQLRPSSFELVLGSSAMDAAESAAIAFSTLIPVLAPSVSACWAALPSQGWPFKIPWLPQSSAGACSAELFSLVPFTVVPRLTPRPAPRPRSGPRPRPPRVPSGPPLPRAVRDTLLLSVLSGSKESLAFTWARSLFRFLTSPHGDKDPR